METDNKQVNKYKDHFQIYTQGKIKQSNETEQFSSQCGLWVSSVSISWALFRKATSQASLKPFQSDALGIGEVEEPLSYEEGCWRVALDWMATENPPEVETLELRPERHLR